MYRIKCSGIYSFQHISGYYYIGKSVDIYNRWSSHYTDMKMNKHHSPKVQELFNNSQITEWTFQIIFYLSKTQIKEETGLKGIKLKKHIDSILLKKEKEIMSQYSINFSLNKNNKYFS